MPLGSSFFSGNYSKELKKWKEYDQMPAKDLEKIQNEGVSKLLQLALKDVPYYHNLKLPPNATLKDFPILTKNKLRENADTLISTKYKKENLNKNHSSGSSGAQSVTFMTKQHTFYLRALQTHWWKWGGYNPGELLLQAGMSTKRGFTKTLKDAFFKVKYMDAFNLKAENIKGILKTFNNKKSKHLAGYPSALNEIALAAISENKTYSFKSLISYGDKLFSQYEKNFKKAFQNPTIVNTYGCAEGFLMGCMVDGAFYNIMSPHVFLEIVDDAGKTVEDGQRGHILVTCLTNLAMPIIRYKLGDLGVILPKNEYPKNRRFNYPLLKEVTGRETDVIKAPNGNVLIVHSFTGIFEFYEEIKQFKIIQTSKDKITIEYILQNRVQISLNTQREIEEKLLKLVDNSMKIYFKKVMNITSSPSGKPQIIDIKFDS